MLWVENGLILQLLLSHYTGAKCNSGNQNQHWLELMSIFLPDALLSATSVSMALIGQLNSGCTFAT